MKEVCLAWHLIRNFHRTEFFIFHTLVGNSAGMSRIYVEVVSDSKSVLKTPFWVSKPDFLTCESGNTEGPSILRTCESGNTEGPSILV